MCHSMSLLLVIVTASFLYVFGAVDFFFCEVNRQTATYDTWEFECYIQLIFSIDKIEILWANEENSYWLCAANFMNIIKSFHILLILQVVKNHFRFGSIEINLSSFIALNIIQFDFRLTR